MDASIDNNPFKILTQQEKDKALLSLAAQAVDLDGINQCIQAIYQCSKSGEQINQVINRDAMSAVLKASRTDFTSDINLLIQAGANPNAIGPEGLTALMCAAFFESKNTVNLLIKLGANLKATHSTGVTAFMCAVYRFPNNATTNLFPELSTQEFELLSTAKFSKAIHAIENDKDKEHRANLDKHFQMIAPFLLLNHAEGKNFFKILPLDVVKLISNTTCQVQDLKGWYLKKNDNCFLPLKRALSVSQSSHRLTETEVVSKLLKLSINK